MLSDLQVVDLRGVPGCIGRESEVRQGSEPRGQLDEPLSLWAPGCSPPEGLREIVPNTLPCPSPQGQGSRILRPQLLSCIG